MRLCVLLMLGLLACTDAPPSGPPMVSRVVRMDLKLPPFREIDILFVIDSSPAMAAHRENLIANERRWMTALSTFPGGVPDLHIGVVTADPSEMGRLHQIPSIAGAFLTDTLQSDGTRLRNYTRQLDDVFVDLADVGTSGSPEVQPLEAARRALSNTIENAGFLRDDGFLVVVVVTANEDASPAPIADYTAFLKDSKRDPASVMVLGAFGPCTEGNATAADAPRLRALFEQFPERNASLPICASDLSELFALPAQLIKTTLELRCVPVTLFDRDPARGGTQPECVVWLEHDLTEQTAIAECGSGSPGVCWQLVDQPLCDDPHQTLVLGPNAFAYARATRAIAECLAE